MVYEDPYSPFCLIAETTRDAEEIHDYLEVFCKEVDELVLVRNDVYARFSHKAYNKGTALAEISRRFNVRPEHIFVAGDHLNDIPMLTQAHARWLVSPSNGIDPVKELIRRQNGFISEYQCGHGVVDGLVECLRQCAPREFVAASR
jgi:hydroxymethylpyrimidine pyrophosphatase-like HAD family hydrolase